MPTRLRGRHEPQKCRSRFPANAAPSKRMPLTAHGIGLNGSHLTPKQRRWCKKSCSIAQWSVRANHQMSPLGGSANRPCRYRHFSSSRLARPLLLGHRRFLHEPRLRRAGATPCPDPEDPRRSAGCFYDGRAHTHRLFGSQGLSTSIRDTYHRVPQVDWLFFDKAYAQKVLMNRRSLWPSNEPVALGVMPQ
jgi:hypothetical protein